MDPYPPGGPAADAAHRAAFPLYWSGPPPIVAEVGPGETLYLPALWHHHVAQRLLPGPGNERVLAVNFWRAERTRPALLCDAGCSSVSGTHLAALWPVR